MSLESLKKCFFMKNFKFIKLFLLIFLILNFVISCKNGKLPGGDARKNPPDPVKRVQKNLEEGFMKHLPTIWIRSPQSRAAARSFEFVA